MSSSEKNPFAFPDSQVAGVYRAIQERRDMRHFRPGKIDAEILHKLLDAAHHAPSVGLMQPWRFIRITSDPLRQKIYDLVQEERLETAHALGERESEFLRLKVEGIKQCGELLIANLCDNRERFIFGRRTLPEMDLASVACAIQNLWLAARAEGLGMGWVSIFDPVKLATLLHLPAGAKPIAIICLGYVDEFYTSPMLVEAGWAKERPLAELMMENQWTDSV
ncbi:5,6-dimethylbenzimidazole synthase [Methylobacillus gramineus]|uniref:5,6-dimethylbenzimidazole synthase n=1 Tax=Methylobacillus gramineus TaxID=755169 RepID=UPI001CFFFC7F|nr:5,6-dimethylbenzimidazole synthase [Methylobacillus gramineus]MCB5185502.1 5,6-dimethylbenzimidazole synthase [Methylobacillus gramineus]